MRSRIERRLIAVAALIALVAAISAAPAAAAVAPQLGVGQGSTDNSVYYVDWRSANAANGTASGLINLPDGTSVGVTFAAVFADGSPGSMAFAQTGCGTNFWNPSSPYISPEVPNAPPGCDMLALRGGQNQIYRLTLSEAIRDPLMAIVSLGANGTSTTYDFDSPFTIVSQGRGFFGGDSTRLQQLPGDVLMGTEGHGTIRFLGTFSTFSWTVPTPEFWHGYTFGIRTTEALAQPVTVNEGGVATNSGTWSGEDVSLSASVGDVTKNADGTWDWSLLTADGPTESQNVTITATNAFGRTSRSFDLVVENVVPAATLTNNGPAVEGAPLHVSFSGQADPSSTDTAAGLRYAFACDGGSLDGTTYAAASFDAFAECTYPTSGDATVRARIIDKDGGFTERTTTTTIQPARNSAPLVILSGPNAADEGQTKHYTYDTTDVDSSSFTHAVGCGASGTVEAGTDVFDTTTGDGSFSCSFSDDDPTVASSDPSTVGVTVDDDSGGSDTDSIVVTVSNVNPVATITAPGPDSLHSVTTAVNLSATFTDAGNNDAHTCSIDWGDGSAATAGTLDQGADTCTASHAYAAAGLYTISATVTDDDTGYDTETVGIVVYDPSAGFVTGGGWIDSPSGAYTPGDSTDPDVTGKATFGFISKYHKGASVPSGQTEFRFEAAGLRFHSSTYDWLVVSGPKAQFKGSGAVNGVTGYGFLLTVTDGQVTGGGGIDRFRMKIWEIASDDVVYDNGAAESALGGGQIMIHTK
ncbi:MAG: PKD domain-containing protein [Actinomycetota bacterium]